MRIVHIVACTSDFVIGKDNKLLWHIPEDLSFFEHMTMGHPIIMGKSTFRSIGKPLPGRPNLVLSQTSSKLKGAKVFSSLASVWAHCKRQKYETVFIIGGAQVYSSTMDVVDEICMTFIRSGMGGDAFYPNGWDFRRTFKIDTISNDYYHPKVGYYVRMTLRRRTVMEKEEWRLEQLAAIARKKEEVALKDAELAEREKQIKKKEKLVEAMRLKAIEKLSKKVEKKSKVMREPEVPKPKPKKKPKPKPRKTKNILADLIKKNREDRKSKLKERALKVEKLRQERVEKQRALKEKLQKR